MPIELKFTGEIITPVFMAGINPELPELRITSFKSILRYWTRVLLSNFNYNLFMDEQLDTFENYIFGGKVIKGKNEFYIKSPIGINITKPKFEKISFYDFQKYGLKYLAFGFRKAQGRPARYGFPAGTKFDFNIRINNKYSKQYFDDETLSEFLFISVWLSSYLGGYGARTSRGFGSIIFSPKNEMKIKEDILPLFNNKDIKNINEYYERSFEIISKWVKKKLIDRYKIISKNNSYGTFLEIYIIDKDYDNWDVALNELGDVYMKFRKSHRMKVLDISNGKHNYENFELAIFGLPINFYFPKRHLSAKLFGFSDSIKYERWASPLKFKIIKINGKYKIILLLNKNRIFKKDLKLKIKGKEYEIRNFYNKDIIEEFFNYLKLYYNFNKIEYTRNSH